MGLNRNQGITIGVFGLLFMVLYFLVPTTPKERQEIDVERSKKFSTFDPSGFLAESRQLLPPGLLGRVESLELKLDSAKAQDVKVEIYKQLSSTYNQMGNFAAGGIMAEQVAEIAQTDTAWSITGSTYFSGFQNAKDTLLREYCFEKAVQSFESAISINPEEPAHRVNLGLCYVEGSPAPMKGILMIRELLDKYPDNVTVLFTLGRLSMRTAQYDKAIERFEKVVTIEDTNLNAIYMLAQAYGETGEKAKAISYYQKALALNNDPTFQANVSNIITELEN
ncbi:MAG: tetratricopeptide repeat protein [Bacteroidota bacterium]